MKKDDYVLETDKISESNQNVVGYVRHLPCDARIGWFVRTSYDLLRKDIKAHDQFCERAR